MKTLTLPGFLSLALAAAPATAPMNYAIGAAFPARQTESAHMKWAEILEVPIKFTRKIASPFDRAIFSSPAQIRALNKSGNGISLRTFGDIVRLRGALLDKDLETKILELLEGRLIAPLSLSMSETDLAMIKSYGRMSPYFPLDSYLERLPGISRATVIEFAQEGVDTIAEAISRGADFWSRQGVSPASIEDLKRAFATTSYVMHDLEAQRIEDLPESYGGYLARNGVRELAVDELSTLRINRIIDLNRLNLDDLFRLVAKTFDRESIIALMKTYSMPLYGNAQQRAQAAADRWGITLSKNNALPSLCINFSNPR